VSDQQTYPFSLVSILVFLVILAVPISILFGFATATEAASIGVVGTALLMVFSSNHSSSRFTQYKKALGQSVELTGVIFGIIMAASVLALVFRGLGGDESVSELLSNMPGDAVGAFLVVMLVIFLLGFIVEFIEIIYIVIPVTAPVLFALGIDPIWFAVMVAINLQISFLTPPLGIALFYYQSVSKIKTVTLYKGVIPFIGLQILALIIVYFFPKLATLLPAILI
jgi:tripartite ATP-independent transporter DctM subunit